jgi:hypothetical protein
MLIAERNERDDELAEQIARSFEWRRRSKAHVENDLSGVRSEKRVRVTVTLEDDLIRTAQSYTYLENTGVMIDGVSFWGSPYTPEFLRWAFIYRSGAEAKRCWAQIPRGLDVLVTHGPPYGILDQTAPGGEHLGCMELLKAVKAKKPRIHIFGQIHGGAGTYENGDTQFVNAAYLDEQYRPAEPTGIIRVVNL